MPKTESEDTHRTDPTEHGTLKPVDDRHVVGKRFPKSTQRSTLFIGQISLGELIAGVKSKTGSSPSTSVPESETREMAAYRDAVGKAPGRKEILAEPTASSAGMRRHRSL
jgi:hypothetical protein